MKKKTIIIPVILLSSLLGACNRLSLFKPDEVSPIGIQEWLDASKDPSENPNCGEFWIKENAEEKNRHSDYELKVRDIIKNNVPNNKGSQIDSKGLVRENVDFVGYQLRADLSRLDNCIIYVYDDGTVTTQAYGSGWGAPKPQFYVYDVGKTITDKIINEVKERYYEIDETLNNIYETVKEEATLDKFFTNVEESTTPALIKYHETRKDEKENSFNYHDDDRSVLNDLKELEYSPKDKDFTIDILPMITYGVTEKWTLQIFCGWDNANYDVAAIDYVYEGQYAGYYTTHYMFYYSINATKASALADKIRSTH